MSAAAAGRREEKHARSLAIAMVLLSGLCIAAIAALVGFCSDFSMVGIYIYMYSILLFYYHVCVVATE